MAYKDEYEVARLYADPEFMQRMREQFSGDFTLRFNLAPPMLPGRDASGRPKKRSFGAWMLPAFRMLAGLKGLRGTAFDRSEEHTSELQSLMRISYAVFCLKKTKPREAKQVNCTQTSE